MSKTILLTPKQSEVVNYHLGPLAVNAGAGCLTGDTVIIINRGGNSKPYSLKNAFKSWTEYKYKVVGFDKSIDTYTRSLCSDNEIRLHRVNDIVFSGRKKIYKLTLDNGYFLKGTHCHKIMTDKGWVRLGHLDKTSMVMCDTKLPQKSKLPVKKRRDKVVRCLKYYPMGYSDKKNTKRVEEYRLAFEAKINNLSLEEIILILRTDEKRSKCLEFLSKDFDVHHANGDHEDNSPDNLVKMLRSEHKKLHAPHQYKKFSQGVPEFSKVAKVEYIGYEDTYDICCDEPYHNFVANNIVVHNSGKSRVIIERTVRMVNELNIRPESIYVTTFTNKATDELVNRFKERLGSSVAKRLNVSTIHGMCYSFLIDIRKNLFHDFRHRKLASEFEIFMKVKDAIKTMKELNCILLPKPMSVLDSIQSWKNEGLLPKVIFESLGKKEDQWKEMINTEPHLVAYYLYQKRLVQDNKMDFDDMLAVTYDLLVKNDRALTYISRKIKHLTIDESHDNNSVQHKLVELLTRKIGYSYTLVYDLKQCQPEGNKVLLTGGMEVDISKIKKGDSVVSSTDKNRFAGIKAQGRKVSNTNCRPYTGNLFTFIVNGRSTSTTDTHKFRVRFNQEKANKLHVVYLMRKGDDFRIGWCKLFVDSTGTNHFFHRCRTEGADCGWILKITESRSEASFYESYFSSKYGIPLILFNPIHGNTIYTEEFLSRFFSKCKPWLYSRGIKVITDFKLSLEHPFYSAYNQLDTDSRRNRGGRSTIFTCAACNIHSGYMELPLINGTEVPTWSKISSINVEHVKNLPVYSLDVETNHTYVSNGIGTCNSMYSFRGACPEGVLKLINQTKAHVIDLETNFRSCPVIVETSNTLIKHTANKETIGILPVAHKKDQGELNVHCVNDEVEEVDVLMERLETHLENGLRLSNVAVLYRTHAQSREIIDRLSMLGFPYETNSEENFYDRRDVKTLLRYLKVAVRPSEATTHDVWAILSVPNKFINKAVFERMWKAKGKKSIDELFTSALNYTSNQSEIKAFSEMYNLIKKIRSMESSANALAAILSFGVLDHFCNDKRSKDSSDDSAMCFYSMQKLCEKCTTPESILEHVDQIIEHKEQMKTKDRVMLMTYHASKGLEWKSVFMIGVSQGILPHSKSEDINEERRICYVGMTRAIKYLDIISINGSFGTKIVRPSLFLREMGRWPKNVVF